MSSSSDSDSSLAGFFSSVKIKIICISDIIINMLILLFVLLQIVMLDF